jgi:membrane-associated phospholipid phosphatase
MATGNHFWLDVVAGVIVAVIALVLVYRNPFRRLRATRAAAQRL